MHAKFFWQLFVKDSSLQVSMTLIVEARLSGLESVNQILNSKEYNYGTRVCKVIFEAL